MATEGKITIGGAVLSYRIEGEGVPVLVIGSAAFYPRLFSPDIRKRAKLIFIDHKGFAELAELLPAEAYTLDAIVEDIETMRAALELDRFVALGHSGHAFLAAAYARKYPQHVSKVALMNAAPTNDEERQRGSIAYFEAQAEPERKRKFEEDFAALPADLEREPERRFAWMCIRMGAHSFRDYGFDAAPLWEGVRTNMPVIDHLWGEAFAQRRLTEELGAIHKPVWIGLGRHDYLVAPVSLWDDAERNRPNVTKMVFEESGHYPMLEEPGAFDEAFLRWVYRPE
ncbi:alpha/beta hydrolase [Paenibacillus sp.]|uniref:alpha/beta fold hydrolase n=1 Tax=Paenibacillus sp. TaxID=58172 RepID=UPI002D4AC933|nr:alpha/beta hydrolase [Paenibacillus sp.]HZG85485.1 alpha/beta hydrolase [Paenibacillus sp.]